MDLLKAIFIASILTGCVALIIGSQGTSGGPLEVFAFQVQAQKLYWSWPIFLGGTGLTWSLMLLQR